MRHAESILASGVRVTLGQRETDFGPGFYTTTLERQAQTWAHERVSGGNARRAAVLAFDIDREQLARLAILSFVRGDFAADDFWSLVVHCRSTSHTGHGRSGANPMYDVVSGPVASFWRQRLMIADADQTSFHTRAAQDVLNDAPRAISWISNL
jgi:hypothetical protein